jgi:hypothetical protein
MKYIMLFEQWLAERQPLLLEGGAAGHMMHPFDDTGLTFGDLKTMVTAGLSGNLTFSEDPTEKCLSGDTIVTLKKGGNVTIKDAVDNEYLDDILSMNDSGDLVWLPIIDWINNEKSNEWLHIELECGRNLMVTPNHRIFMEGCDVKAEQLKVGDELIVAE